MEIQVQPLTHLDEVGFIRCNASEIPLSVGVGFRFIQKLPIKICVQKNKGIIEILGSEHNFEQIYSKQKIQR
jgi:hypothetical protein